ncbi:MAG TPA: response regulator transcription factor [Actinomycetota bacterium]|nr:response regulator transcription factor [Actinomycetota bacterium]
MGQNGAPDVLVVEDEPGFIEPLVIGLKRERFHVRVAREGREALALFEASRPDLVLLDVMLPDMSGVDICREMRRKSEVPIIMVSAKTSEFDMVVGLEVGADDYVAKPYRLRELIARMRAAMRRAPMEEVAEEARVLDARGVRIDRDRREVTFHGEPIRLPLKEFELLELLMANAGKVVARKTILDKIWGTTYVGDTKTLDVHVKRLRSRIEDTASVAQRIVTIRGVGYRFDADPVEQPV